MGLEDLRNKPKRVMAIDNSTKSMAYSLFEGKRMIEYGQINFMGDTPLKRGVYAAGEMRALRERLHPDVIVYESSVYINSNSVVIEMSFALGAVISSLADYSTELHRVPPVTWQRAIGNNPTSKVEKEALKKEYPDKKSSWYSTQHRKNRKQKTIDLVNEKYGVNIQSDDVADAIGINWYFSERTENV